MTRKLKITRPKEGGILVNRDQLFRMQDPRKSTVYFFVGERPYSYEQDDSPILYIGETGNQLSRPFTSLEERGAKILKKAGRIRTLSVKYVETGKRPRARMSKELENAFLFEFEKIHGEKPIGNVQRGHYPKVAYRKWFNRETLHDIIIEFAKTRRKRRRHRKKKIKAKAESGRKTSRTWRL